MNHLDSLGKTHQIGLPQALTHAKQLLSRRATDNKVLGKVNAPNTVEAADERLARLGLQASYHRAHKVRAEALLVQGRRDEVGKGRGRNLALLAQAVHVDFVSEEVGDGGNIGGEAGKAKVHCLAVREDLGEVVGDGQGLETESEVAGDGDAVFAHHGYAGAAVWGFVSIVGGGQVGRRRWRIILIEKGEDWHIVSYVMIRCGSHGDGGTYHVCGAVMWN